jgi:hypothetical protein
MIEQSGTVWVFHASNGTFASAVFTSFEDANAWISQHKLSGTLTEYPVGISLYDWAIKHGFFKPDKESHFSPAFIGRFTSAHLQHYHYSEGEA